MMVYKCLKKLTPGYRYGRFQYRAKKTNQRDTRHSIDCTYKRINVCIIRPKVVQECCRIADSVIKMLMNSVCTLMYVSCPY